MEILILLAAALADCPPSCPVVTEIAFAGIASPPLSCVDGMHLFSFLQSIPPETHFLLYGGPWGLHALAAFSLPHSPGHVCLAADAFFLPCAYLIFTHNHKCN